MAFLPADTVASIGLNGLLPGTIVHGHVVRRTVASPRIDDQWLVTRGLTDPVAQLVDVLEESRIAHSPEK